MKKRQILITLVVFFFSSVIYADLLTIVEDAKLLDATLEQIKQIKAIQSKLKNQLKVLDNQKKLLESSNKAMTGHYNYGTIDNPLLKNWQHSGKNWDSLLEGTDKDALTRLKKQIASEFPLSDANKLFTLQNSEQTKLFNLLSKATLASRASQTLAYNSVDDELLLLEQLQERIEQTPNQKAILDLIARIQIEEAKLSAYQIKANAVNAQLSSLQSQQELTDAKWANDFFKWHN
ncbi:vir protein B5 [Legionella nautarum]|uniref:Vir protein B5 n=1 Tax=Legionella nautarum TaxID=45070 RepID=A0A0W0WIK4_9GAMM|nr:type IV secretion system protein [Legionella nautarum]KTD32196.1 vir protein B5 [Legionella nautarum]